MSILDQVVKTVETAPLSGKLREIEAILERVSDPGDELDQDAALRAIAAIAGSSRSTDIYQKPLG
ncbi:MAG TPA: hypothetical protein VF633_04200 [Brevundimonas sp.]